MIKFSGFFQFTSLEMNISLILFLHCLFNFHRYLLVNILFFFLKRSNKTFQCESLFVPIKSQITSNYSQFLLIFQVMITMHLDPYYSNLFFQFFQIYVSFYFSPFTFSLVLPHSITKTNFKHKPISFFFFLGFFSSFFFFSSFIVIIIIKYFTFFSNKNKLFRHWKQRRKQKYNNNKIEGVGDINHHLQIRRSFQRT